MQNPSATSIKIIAIQTFLVNAYGTVRISAARIFTEYSIQSLMARNVVPIDQTMLNQIRDRNIPAAITPIRVCHTSRPKR